MFMVSVYGNVEDNFFKKLFAMYSQLLTFTTENTEY